MVRSALVLFLCLFTASVFGQVGYKVTQVNCAFIDKPKWRLRAQNVGRKKDQKPWCPTEHNKGWEPLVTNPGIHL